MDETQKITHITIPAEVTPKGVQVFTIDLDDYELIENGTKEKNGHLVYFHKYKKL